MNPRLTTEPDYRHARATHDPGKANSYPTSANSIGEEINDE